MSFFSVFVLVYQLPGSSWIFLDLPATDSRPSLSGPLVSNAHNALLCPLSVRRHIWQLTELTLSLTQTLYPNRRKLRATHLYHRQRRARKRHDEEAVRRAICAADGCSESSMNERHYYFTPIITNERERERRWKTN